MATARKCLHRVLRSLLDRATEAVARLGAETLRDHEWRPWGCRIVVADPDGRAVEVNQRGHCAERSAP